MPQFIGAFTLNAQEIMMQEAYKDRSSLYPSSYQMALVDCNEKMHGPEIVSVLRQCNTEVGSVLNVIFGFTENYNRLEIETGEFKYQKSPDLHADPEFFNPKIWGFLLSRIGGCATWVMPHEVESLATAEQMCLIEQAKQKEDSTKEAATMAIKELKDQGLLNEIPLGKIGLLLYRYFDEATQKWMPGTLHVSGLVRPQNGRKGVYSTLVHS
jgi:hypothetical protein